MGYRPLGTFRLFLALLVVFQHYVQWVFPGAVQRAVMPFEPGSTAVYVFFCLSGLVIAEAADRVYRGRTIAFAANRFLRIVPLYVATIAATVAAIVMIVLGYILATEVAKAWYSRANLSRVEKKRRFL